MTQDDLTQMSREELIELVLAQFGQITKLQADFEALKMKLEKEQETTHELQQLFSATVAGPEEQSA